MRHSSSFALGMNITSGSGIIHGFKYLSPATQKQEWCKVLKLCDPFIFARKEANKLLHP
jgi:hypothetical protein